MAKTETKTETKSKATVAVVTYPGNPKMPSGTREYSKEVHGDNFAKLAESFATKFNGTVELA